MGTKKAVVGKFWPAEGEAGLSYTTDENGKRHFTAKVEPFVILRDGPASVSCGQCGDEREFQTNGPTYGWVPPFLSRATWTCPDCIAQTVTVTKGAS